MQLVGNIISNHQFPTTNFQPPAIHSTIDLLVEWVMPRSLRLKARPMRRNPHGAPRPCDTTVADQGVRARDHPATSHHQPQELSKNAAGQKVKTGQMDTLNTVTES